MQNINEEKDAITVFMVDDHDVVRKGLRFYLNARPEITIVVPQAGTESWACNEHVKRQV